MPLTDAQILLRRYLGRDEGREPQGGEREVPRRAESDLPEGIGRRWGVRGAELPRG